MGIGLDKTYVVAVRPSKTDFDVNPQKTDFQRKINTVRTTVQQLSNQAVVARVDKLSGNIATSIRQVKNLSVQQANDDITPMPEKYLSFQGGLKIQENMLKAACRSLRLWGVQDQRYFKAIFGQAHANQRGGLRDKKEEIYQQLSKMLDLNKSTARKISSRAAIPLDFALPYPSKQMKDFCVLSYLTPFEKSLKAQRKILEAARDQLKQWGVEDQKRFRSIFGHSVISKRANVYSQIDKMLEQNKKCLTVLTVPGVDMDMGMIDLNIPRFATNKLEKYCSLAYQHAIGKE